MIASYEVGVMSYEVSFESMQHIISLSFGEGRVRGK